ncbi:MAG: hypothetical protein KDB37_00915 [Ilumatobacter sp.]|nr:hypothetical protein [Ilumatobacter sp.]
MTTTERISSTTWPTDLREPTTSEAILHNVRSILPVVTTEAAPSNEQGYMTSAMTEACRAAGIFRVGFSRERGGPEMSISDQTRMVEMVATVDASIAWNVTVLAATGFYAGRLSDGAFAELYPDLDRATCGSFHPKGVARQVEGGYRVSGNWNFGSGIRSSDRIVAGAEVVDEVGEPVLKDDGSQLTLGVWLPTDDVRLRDDWHTIGLRGSGSQGYAVDDVFVPADHSFDRFFAGNATAPPLSKHPDLPFYSMGGISLGIARHAIDIVSTELAKRSGARAPGERSLALLGEADSCLRAMRATIYAGLSQLDEETFTPGAVPSTRALARGDAPFAAELARRVLDICVDLYGSKTIYEVNPLEQLIRDLVGLSVHLSTSRAMWSRVGQVVLDEYARDGEGS